MAGPTADGRAANCPSSGRRTNHAPGVPRPAEPATGKAPTPASTSKSPAGGSAANPGSGTCPGDQHGGRTGGFTLTSKASLRAAFRRLTGFGFPLRFPIVQFPNLPLIVAFLAGQAGTFLNGTEHAYAASVSYLAMTIWAYEELVHGVNWFRRVLGLTFVILLIMRVARAVHP